MCLVRGKKRVHFSSVAGKKNLSSSPGDNKGDTAIRFVQGKSHHFKCIFLHLKLLHVNLAVFMGSIVGIN